MYHSLDSRVRVSSVSREQKDAKMGRATPDVYRIDAQHARGSQDCSAKAFLLHVLPSSRPFLFRKSETKRILSGRLGFWFAFWVLDLDIGLGFGFGVGSVVRWTGLG